ncbi:hypothetical protein B0H13DRAFT_1589934, partial [Mycena leptocephala]
FHSSFHGMQVDDDKTEYLVTVWQSADHCASFVQGAAYPDFLAALKPAAAGELELHHVHAGSVDPSVALSAPTTEFVLFTLKAGVTMAEISPLFEELARGLDAAKGARPPCLWAPTRDSANQVLVFVGWDTVEV